MSKLRRRRDVVQDVLPVVARIGFGVTAVRWSQLGFGHTSTTSTAQATPRNMFGFKDGTANLKADDPALLDRHVWVGDEGPPWLRGGSYLVARRIRMTIETWDRTCLAEQEAVIGRHKGSGAPIGRSDDPVDLDARGPDGALRTLPSAHVRLAAPETNAGAALLRRGYSFVDGNDALGRLDAGLLLISFSRDPEQFTAVQRRLAASDALNEYIRHVGSGLFACPPGPRPGQSWAAAVRLTVRGGVRRPGRTRPHARAAEAGSCERARTADCGTGPVVSGGSA